MSAHVLLNLLNKLGKRDKMQGLQSILLLFRNEFNKFNNTGARMLDSIYHMTLKLLKKVLGMKTSRFCHLLCNVIINFIRLLNCKPLMVYRFYCMALYNFQMRCHVIKSIESN